LKKSRGTAVFTIENVKCYQTIFRVTPQISLHYDTLEIQA